LGKDQRFLSPLKNTDSIIKMFTDLIKEATLINHQQVEKTLVGKMKSMRSKQDYVELLHLFYSYFAGLEQQINAYINPSNLPDHAGRRKTEAIADDLKALGSQVPVIANGDDLPQINNELQAFGALYVIEGSTLGGKIISKMIQQYLNINDGTGLSFFDGYGDQTQQMWDTFKQKLNDIVKSEADEETVLAAANQTFSQFKQWIETGAIAFS
jgi:heme oxygenase